MELDWLWADGESSQHSDRANGQRKKGGIQAHQLTIGRRKPSEWPPVSIVDFSREFHDEAAIATNITRAAHLFERAQMDADAFIAQVYAACRSPKGAPTFERQTEVGKNPAWPDGFPNGIPYFFSILENLLGPPSS